MFNVLKRGIENLLGLEAMQPVAAFIARMGLRGVGINLSYKIEQSGEKHLLQRIGASCPGFTCLDIGANAGRYSLAAKDAGATRVVAFEPGPKTFNILSSNLSGSDVEAHCAAVGEDVGETEIFVPRMLGLASRDAGAGGFPENEAERITAPMTTVDKFCTENDFFPTLIKIDVEGFEAEVLAGAQALIVGDKRPEFVQFEFNLPHLYRRQTLDDFKALLPGYHFFRITASGLSRIGAYRGMDTIFGYMNILASRAEKPF